jgi:hypothetical protein
LFEFSTENGDYIAHKKYETSLNATVAVHYFCALYLMQMMFRNGGFDIRQGSFDWKQPAPSLQAVTINLQQLHSRYQS